MMLEFLSMEIWWNTTLKTDTEALMDALRGQQTGDGITAHTFFYCSKILTAQASDLCTPVVKCV